MPVDERLATPLPSYLDSAAVAQLLGVPYRSLMHWVEAGLVRPCGGGGKRAPRWWNPRHVQEARIVRALRREGVPIAGLGAVMEVVRGLPEFAGQLIVVPPGGGCGWLLPVSTPLGRRRLGGVALVYLVDLEQVAREGEEDGE